MFHKYNLSFYNICLQTFQKNTFMDIFFSFKENLYLQ